MKINPDRAQCLRCGHRDHLNRNELCRLCLLTVRTIDKTWLADPGLGQATQLFLLLKGLPLPIARALDREPKSPRTLPPRNPGWVCAALDIPTADDPTICPPLPPGQLKLFSPPRTFTLHLATRITDRTPPGYLEAVEIARRFAAELRRTDAWRRQLYRIIGLVLAAAEADGHTRIPHGSLVNALLADSAGQDLPPGRAQASPVPAATVSPGAWRHSVRAAPGGAEHARWAAAPAAAATRSASPATSAEDAWC
jgi:hypothetical protein